MQPYFFPYIGYFQLIKCVDKFVFYDDVNFIKGGWINRNRILVNNEPHYINIEMKGASSFRKINEIEINTNYVWRKKMLSTIKLNYKNAPNFPIVFSLIEDVLDGDYNYLNDYVKKSIRSTCMFLNISTEIVDSSSKYQNEGLRSTVRILDICEKEKASNYINPIGGVELYKKEDFNGKNIQLLFVGTQSVEYGQFGHKFVPWLSIIDVMMFNNPIEISKMLDKFKLL